VVVGLSGGVDSIVLLDLLHDLAPSLRLRPGALHVNHQLSPNAARWSAFCARVCRRRGIPYRSVKVTVGGDGGVEAAARAARYAVFARQRCDHILLAQHQDDQVETFLLQLLRGAGVQGLAAMPLMRKDERHPSIVRPLLDVTRAEILAYARERGLEWIEDESNADVRRVRNYLRHEVLPVLGRRFPAYRETISRAARHLAESASLLAEVAAEDGAGAADTLPVEALRRLAPARARNLLRHFLGRRGISMPPTARLEEALRQALHAPRDAQVRIELGELELRRFDARLYLVARRTGPDSGYTQRWSGESVLALPGLGGELLMAPGRGRGLSLARLRAAPVTIRLRRGGERLQPRQGRPRRTLKNLLQEAGIPPWERDRLPLIYSGSRLAWAAAIGADCSYQAQPGERSVAPSWQRPGN
jgi:tRNA(Ile)-lysidine synthase